MDGEMLLASVVANCTTAAAFFGKIPELACDVARHLPDRR